MAFNLKKQKNLLSKIAVSDGHGEKSPYFAGWMAYDEDPYHHSNNPLGVIQMGLAENELCFDLIEKWVVDNPEASICTAEGATNFRDIAIFQDYHGLREFRNAVAKFMERVRGDRVTFDPDRIVMSGGTSGAHEMMAFCLADTGDAFLVPTPYYPGFDRDLRWRTGAQLFPVVCDSSNNFMVTKSSLEAAYDKAIEANINIKGLLITNPSNPLGTILDRETLKSIVSFVIEKNIHLVCDEIYAATVFSQPKFVSIAEIIEEVECNREFIHIVCSLSKDLGFSGFGIGIVYSYNDKVVHRAREMSSFGLVSTQTQHLVASMLSDDEFIDKFIAQSAKRLKERHGMFTRGLAQLGIGSLKSNAGLFVWMDLRRLLKEPTFEAEIALWQIIIHEVKLNVSPGSSCHCSEPGWFRVCFANMDDETIKVALRRIKNFVGQNKELEVSTKKQSRRGNLQVSLSFRRLDGIKMAPHKLSPHHLWLHLLLGLTLWQKKWSYTVVCSSVHGVWKRVDNALIRDWN